MSAVSTKSQLYPAGLAVSRVKALCERQSILRRLHTASKAAAFESDDR